MGTVRYMRRKLVYMVRGQIKVGKNTTRHAQWLNDHGYKAAVEGDVLAVEVSRIVGVTPDETLDLSVDPLTTLQGIVDRKEGIAYSARIRFADGKVLFGVPACTRLGRASALVMKPVKARKPAKASEFDAL